MRILFKHNFRNVEADRYSKEAIKVEGFDSHVMLGGFIDKRRVPRDAQLVKLISNGWKAKFTDPWTYLVKGEYIQGVLIDSRVYVVTDRWKPLIAVM